MINEVFSHDVVKNSSIVFLGNILSSIFGFLVVFLLTRTLATNYYGLIITGFTFVEVSAEVLEFGIRPAVLNFLPRLSIKKNSYKKITFILTILVAFFALIGILILSQDLARIFFNSLLMIPLLRIAAFGVSFLMLIYWGQALFQSEGRFIIASVSTSLINLTRVILIIILLLFGSLRYDIVFFLMQIGFIIPVIFLSVLP